MEKNKRPIYLPIDLKDVFKLIEEGKADLIYYFNGDGELAPAKVYTFRLCDLPKKSFYVRQDYIPKAEQDVQV